MPIVVNLGTMTLVFELRSANVLWRVLVEQKPFSKYLGF
jgi:hypothetical protein